MGPSGLQPGLFVGWEGRLHSPTCNYLFAKGHPTAQGTGEPDDLSYKGLEGEVFLQHHSPKDGFHLRDARPCRRTEPWKLSERPHSGSLSPTPPPSPSFPTDSLRGQDLGESSRESDEDDRVGNPSQVLE